MPIAGVFFLENPRAWVVLCLLSIIFGHHDSKNLREAGYKAPSVWWVFILMPVYHWQRGSATRSKPVHFWFWAGTFLLSVALNVAVMQEGSEEEAARPLVTQIVREQWGGSARCTRVLITRDLGRGYYHAIAYLDNGRSLAISIQTGGNMVYVTIP